MKRCLITFLLILSAAQFTAQETRTVGTLIKFNISDSKIDTTQTLGKWEILVKPNNSNYQHFENLFTYGNTLYLIRNNSSYTFGNFYPPTFQKTIINSQTSIEKIFCSGWYPECGTGIYLSSNTNVHQISNAFVLTINLISYCYIFRNDSLITLNTPNSKTRILHIVGKVNQQYLVVTKGDVGIEYYLEELNNSQTPKFNNKVFFEKISSSFSLAPKKIVHLVDSYYLINFEWNNLLYIMKFENNLFTPIDSIEIDSRNWFFRSGNLFYFHNDYLVKREFFSSLLRFGNQESVMKIGLKQAVDNYDNYFATIISDSLKIFSFKNNKSVNSLFFKNNASYGSLLIDSPYVFIHKINKITSKRNELGIEKNLPTEFVLHQNYPNPFNPTTTISFVVPGKTRNLKDFSPDPSNDGRGRNDNVWVTLKVYDALGREVATLVDEYKQPGIYDSQFSIDNSKLTSGVYFYTLKAGNFTGTKKMLYLK
jgi:hypothetical protein